MDRGAWWAPWGRKESDITEQLTHISPAEEANKFLHFHFYQIECEFQCVIG